MEEPIQFPIECPVCYDPIVPPFNQCVSGHLLCHECIPRLETCPICRETIDKRRIRNYQLENMARKFTYPCPYTSSGCDIVLKLDELESHKFDCSFAMFNYCSTMKIPKCKLVMTSSDLIPHLLEQHQIPSLLSDIGSFEIHQVGNLSSAYEMSKQYWNPVIFLYDDYKFCLLTEYKAGIISWIVIVLGSKAVAKEFTAAIDVGSFDQNRSLGWKGQVTSFHSARNGEGSRFSVPVKTLANFSRKTDDAEKFWWSRPCKKNDEQWKLKIQMENTSKNVPANLSKDLLIVDSKSVETEHECDAVCDCGKPHCSSCGDIFKDEITYKCVKCDLYVLCQKCIDSGVHSRHLFFRFPKNRIFSEVTVTIKTYTYGGCDFTLSLPPRNNETEAETQAETQADTQAETQADTQVDTQAETQAENQSETSSVTGFGLFD